MRQTLKLTLACVYFLFAALMQDAKCQNEPSKTDNKISAISAPYRIEWEVDSGAFFQSAVGEVAETKTPLVFLHNDPGPVGFSKSLAWFLARGENSFSILWCYLNDTGKEFSCWLYRYPQNQLTPIRFTGRYSYSPKTKPTLSYEDGFAVAPPIPSYVGPRFEYKDWTSSSGLIDSLKLTSAAVPEKPGKADAKTRVVANLKVNPLHYVQVGEGNGWRSSGWGELHSLAFDAQNSPYYLILYSNSPTGYAIDLKRAQTYSVDYGERVKFSKVEVPQATEKPAMIDNKVRVRKWERFERSFSSAALFDNPYKEGQVSFIMKSPDGKTTLVPGFWDGGTTWKLRFSPANFGTWSFQSISKTEDLNGKNGTFECVGEAENRKGFITVQPSYRNPHHFAFANGDSFLPVPILGAIGDESSGIAGSAQKESSSNLEPVKKRIDALAASGFNRLIGGFLLPNIKVEQFSFADSKLDKLKAEYFQRMDERVSYCNERGIVPDIGLGMADDSLFERFGSENIFRFWGYVLSRYAAYDVVWNLYEKDGRQLSATTRKNLAELAELTRLYDPYRHIRTAITPGVASILSEVGDSAGGSIPNYGRWQDCITLRGGDLNAVPGFQKDKKPLMIIDEAPNDRLSPEAARRRMWATRFQEAYWVGGLEAFAPGAMTDPEWKSSAGAGEFFHMTKFARLSPSQELLGGAEESPGDRKRRSRAEERIRLTSKTNASPTTAAAQKYVLSIPAREYAIYFEKGGDAMIDLLEATGRIFVTWTNAGTGERLPETSVFGGGYTQFIAPDANGWILHLSRR